MLTGRHITPYWSQWESRSSVRVAVRDASDEMLWLAEGRMRRNLGNYGRVRKFGDIRVQLEFDYTVFN